MNISIVVVAYNEERNIADCLDSLIAQKYSKGNFEIIVVDGSSNDSTPIIVDSYCKKYNYVKLVNNPGRTITSNRNKGIANAQYLFIAFTDADCICPSDWLENLTDGYMKLKAQGKKVGAVGGGNTAGHQFGKVTDAISIAFDSPLSALGSVQTKLLDKVKTVESLACLNILLEKKIVEDVGLFDEQLGNMGEDWDLNYRLRKSGYELFYIPQATVIHKMRFTLSSFIRQMYQYGRGRARLILKDTQTINLKYAVPLLFILCMMLGPLFYFVTKSFLFLIPIIYFPIILLYCVYLSISKKKYRLFPLVFLIYLIIHFIYSIGEFIGLVMLDKLKEM